MAIEDAAVLAVMLARTPDDPRRRDARATSAPRRRAHRAGAARRARSNGRVYHLDRRRGAAAQSRAAHDRRKDAAAHATIGSMIGGPRRRSARAIVPHERATPTEDATHVSDHHRRQPAETVLARRARQAVAAVAAQRRRSRRRQARRHAARAQAAGGRRHRRRRRRRAVAPAFRARLSRIRRRHRLRATRSRWASATTATRRWCRPSPARCKLKGRVHGTEARFARAHTRAQAQDHHARADDHHRHHRRRALRRPREDGVRLRRSAQRGGARAARPTASTSSSSTSRPSTSTWTRSPAWGIEALHRAIDGLDVHRPPCTSATATASRPTSTGRPRSAASGGSTRRSFPALAASRHRPGVGRVPQLQGAARICCRCSRARTCRSA